MLRRKRHGTKKEDVVWFKFCVLYWLGFEGGKLRKKKKKIRIWTLGLFGVSMLGFAST